MSHPEPTGEAWGTNLKTNKQKKTTTAVLQPWKEDHQKATREVKFPKILKPGKNPGSPPSQKKSRIFWSVMYSLVFPKLGKHFFPWKLPLPWCFCVSKKEQCQDEALDCIGVPDWCFPPSELCISGIKQVPVKAVSGLRIYLLGETLLFCLWMHLQLTSSVLGEYDVAMKKSHSVVCSGPSQHVETLEDTKHYVLKQVLLSVLSSGKIWIGLCRVLPSLCDLL